MKKVLIKDMILQFTYHLVNIKLEWKREKDFFFPEFTYHLVNIKRTVYLHYLIVIILFTYHLVNIKLSLLSYDNQLII